MPAMRAAFDMLLLAASSSCERYTRSKESITPTFVRRKGTKKSIAAGALNAFEFEFAFEPPAPRRSIELADWKTTLRST